MRLREFIKENREEINEAVTNAYNIDTPANDSEREDWVLNDEGLYNWARNSGVPI